MVDEFVSRKEVKILEEMLSPDAFAVYTSIKLGIAKDAEDYCNLPIPKHRWGDYISPLILRRVPLTEDDFVDLRNIVSVRYHARILSIFGFFIVISYCGEQNDDIVRDYVYPRCSAYLASKPHRSEITKKTVIQVQQICNPKTK